MLLKVYSLKFFFKEDTLSKNIILTPLLIQKYNINHHFPKSIHRIEVNSKRCLPFKTPSGGKPFHGHGRRIM